MTDHARYMRHAITLGARHKGRTGPNPSVGCVIVKNDIIIGRGITAPGGRPHAEMEALHMAGMKAKGATAYVSLEPCAHEGHTPSCARVLSESGIDTVVTALTDPDPRTSGQGHHILEQSGITVITGVEQKLARETMSGFLSCIEKKRPYYQLKMGVTSDGKIAEKRGFPSDVTGPYSRRYAMLLRSQCDGILIGTTTALGDDPLLTVRLSGLEHTSPTRIIIDKDAKLSLESRLAQTASQTPAILVVAEENEHAAKEKFHLTDIEILPCPVENNLINLNDLSRMLAEKRIGQIMVEGGAALATSFIKSDLIDEIALFKSDKTFGAQALDALDGMTLLEIIKSYDKTESFKLGADNFTLYKRQEKGV